MHVPSARFPFRFRAWHLFTVGMVGLTGLGVMSLKLQASAGDGGTYTTTLLLPDGTVWTAGNPIVNTLGTNPVVANGRVRNLAMADATAISQGKWHVLAIKSDGTLYTWGSNSEGQLGDGAGTHVIPTAHTFFSGWSTVVGVAAGHYHSHVVLSTGDLYGFGDNSTGAIGDGTITDRASPVLIGTGFTAVSAGTSHVIALKSNGDVWAWGRNNEGQLGNGTTTSSTSPVQVSLSNVVAIEAGANHNLALTSTGAVYAWGYNTSGQLGNNSNIDATSPQLIIASGISRISAGIAHSLALTTGGDVYAWGHNANGQLGNNSKTPEDSPVQITALPGVADIAAAQATSFAFTASGEVYGWGDNTSGLIGDGDEGLARSRILPYKLAEAGLVWRVAVPRFSADAGTYGSTLNVTIFNATAGATMTYTINGVDPTAFDTPITPGATLSIDATTTLKARAFNDPQPQSGVTTAVYTLKPSAPSASPFGGIYTSAQPVTLSCATSGATPRYTLNGAEPDDTSTLYTAPFMIDAPNLTVKSACFKTGWTQSPTTSMSYIFQVAQPVFSIPGGAYASGTQIGITTSTPGADIRYTTNGTNPTASSTLLSPGTTIPVGNFNLRAAGFRSGYAQSGNASATYTVTP